MDSYSLIVPEAWIVSNVLGIELSRSEIKVDKSIWKKIAEIHPESLNAAVLHLKDTILNPDYCGQAPHHFENIEAIKITPDGPLLVAIKFQDSRGFPIKKPFVTSVYLIEQNKVQRRLRDKHLRKTK